MGFQEVYLTSTNEAEFELLVQYLRGNKDWLYEEFWVEPLYITAIKYNAFVDHHYGITRYYREEELAWDCNKIANYDISHLSNFYKKGSKFIHLVGDSVGHGMLLNNLCDKFKFLDCIYIKHLVISHTNLATEKQIQELPYHIRFWHRKNSVFNVFDLEHTWSVMF